MTHYIKIYIFTDISHQIEIVFKGFKLFFSERETKIKTTKINLQLVFK